MDDDNNLIWIYHFQRRSARDTEELGWLEVFSFRFMNTSFIIILVEL